MRPRGPHPRVRDRRDRTSRIRRADQRSGKSRHEQVCPRWLHILMPAEHQRGEEASPDARQAKLLEAVEQLSARQGKMLEAAEKRDDAAAEKRMMQTLRSELHQMRDEMIGALAAGKR